MLLGHALADNSAIDRLFGLRIGKVPHFAHLAWFRYFRSRYRFGFSAISRAAIATSGNRAARASSLEGSVARRRVRRCSASERAFSLRRDATSRGIDHTRSFACLCRSGAKNQSELHRRDRWPRAKPSDSGECRQRRRPERSEDGAKLALPSCDMQWRSHRSGGQNRVFAPLSFDPLD